MPLSTSYGVRKSEVSDFVGDNEVVLAWLGKYSGRNVRMLSHRLCRFFKWLRVVKGVSFSPQELLNDQIRLRGSGKILDRQKHLLWVLEHTRDNPDFEGLGDNTKYSMFLAIKNFYEFHEVPLTTAKNVYGRRSRNSRKRKQITLSDAKQIISRVKQRERAILLIVLQSGMEIGAVLNKMNFMWDEVISQLEKGTSRVKVEFDERKGNGSPYFTFFSYDAIQELKKWLLIRERIVLERGEPESHAIFLTQKGTPYRLNNYYLVVDYYRKTKKLPKFVTHQFRKLFKTEASIPERGIDRDVVEFWMGHVNGLASMGGVYDKTPEIHADVIEKEYAKLEPYINIYSSLDAEREADPLFQDLKALRSFPGGEAYLKDVVGYAKERVKQLLRDK
jgi:integrase